MFIRKSSNQLKPKIQNLAELPVNYAIALPTIMTQRLLLNIKRSADPRVDVNTITTVYCDLDFASHPDESQVNGESHLTCDSFTERVVSGGKSN